MYTPLCALVLICAYQLPTCVVQCVVVGVYLYVQDNLQSALQQQLEDAGVQVCCWRIWSWRRCSVVD